MFLTPNLITCHIDNFTLGMKSPTTAYLLSGSAYNKINKRLGFFYPEVNGSPFLFYRGLVWPSVTVRGTSSLSGGGLL